MHWDLPREIEHTSELLLSLAGEHSIVVVEHDMSFVRSIARRVIVLHEGRVLADGNMDKVQNDPRVIEVYLGSERAGVKGLNQFYGGSHTLWDVDLAVPAGSRMCLMGRNGTGKTTLLKCIMGLQSVSSGGISSRESTCSSARPSSAPGWGSVTCRRAVKFSRI